MKKRVEFLILLLLLTMLVAQVSAFEFCEDGVVNEDKLRIISVDDMEINNPIEWEWVTGEEIEVEVRIQNKDTQYKNYAAELVFVKDGETEEIVKNEDDLIKEASLNSLERKTLLFRFKIDEEIEGDYGLYVKLYERGNENSVCTENSEINVSIESLKICEEGSVDENDLEINYIRDESDEDPWVWKPGKNIKIKLEAQNKNFEEGNYIAELILLNKDYEEVEFSKDSDELKRELTIAEDETDDLTFEFELKDAISSGGYYLYAKVYAQDNLDICTSLRAEELSNQKKIKMKLEEDSVVISSVNGPKELFSKENITYKVMVSNNGENDQKKVKVSLFNSVMDIKLEKEIENLESGTGKEIDFNFEVPKDINDTPKTLIYFSTEYKYNPNTQVYRQFSNDDEELELLVELIKRDVKPEPELESDSEPVLFEEEVNQTDLANSTPEVDSVITGNVVGETGDANQESRISYKLIILIVFIVFIAGLFLFLRNKRPQKKTNSYVSKYDDYKVIKRYSARVN